MEKLNRVERDYLNLHYKGLRNVENKLANFSIERTGCTTKNKIVVSISIQNKNFNKMEQ